MIILKYPFNILLVLLFVVSTNCFARNEWLKIQPLNECKEFNLYYRPEMHEGNLYYVVKFPTDKYEVQFEEYPHPLKDINNLNAINTKILEYAKVKCPELSTATQAISGDLNQCLILSHGPLSDDYIEFSKNVLALLDKDVTSCKEFKELEIIGKEIEAKSIKDLINKKENKKYELKFFGIFLNKENKDKVIQFKECGGKKFSSQFIKNSIILNAKKECIFPKPQGYLDFTTVNKIAEEIAAKYDNKGLGQLFFKTDDIEREAVIKLAEASMKSGIANILGKDINDPSIAKITNKSKVLKHFKKKLEHTKKPIRIGKVKTQPETHVYDYLANVFSTDVLFETTELMLPTMFRDNFIDQFPSSMSKAEKLKHIDEVLSPKAHAIYLRCINPIKKELNVSFDKPEYKSSSAKEINKKDQLLINSRKEKSAKFCKIYSDKCFSTNECNNDLTFLNVDGMKPSETPPSEMKKIQSCLFKSIIDIIPNFLDPIIAGQKKYLEKYVEFTPAFENKLKKKALDGINECFIKEGKVLTNQDIYTENEFKAAALESVTSDEFLVLIETCAGAGQDYAAIFAISESMKNMKEITDNIPNLEEKNLFVDTIVDTAYNACMAKQNKVKDKKLIDHSIEKKDPMLCVPMIEIMATEAIIIKQLEATLNESGFTTQEKDEFFNDYKTCVKESYDEYEKDIGNVNSKNYVRSESDSKQYLDANSGFLNCNKEIILKSTEYIAKKELEKEINLIDEVTDKKYALSLRDEAQSKTRECFASEMEKFDKWDDFKINFVSEENILKVKEKCTSEVTSFLTANILKNETIKEFIELKKQNLLYQEEGKYQYGNILSLSADKVRRRYELTLPADLPSSKYIEWSLENGLKAELEKGGTSTTFIDQYKEDTTAYAISVIRGNFFTIFDKKAKEMNASNYPKFKDAITSECLQDLIPIFQKEFKLQTSSTEAFDAEKSMREISKVILDGLAFQTEIGGFDKQMTKVKSFCNKSKDYKKFTDISKTDAFDFLIKQQVYEKLNKKLDQSARDQYAQNLLDIDESYIDMNGALGKNPFEFKAGKAAIDFLNYVAPVFGVLKTSLDPIDRLIKLAKKLNKKLKIKSPKDTFEYLKSYKGKYEDLTDPMKQLFDMFALNSKKLPSTIESKINERFARDPKSLSDRERKFLRMRKKKINTKNIAAELYRNYRDRNSFIPNQKTHATAQFKDMKQINKKHIKNKKEFNKIMFNDRTISTYALSNISKILKEGSEEATKLETKITKKLFSTRDGNKFTDEFVKNQITYSVSIATPIEALDEIDKTDLVWYKNFAEKDSIRLAKSELKKHWTPKNAGQLLDWKAIDKEHKDKLKNEIVSKIILPSALEQQILLSAKESVKGTVSSQLKNYVYPGTLIDYDTEKKVNNTFSNQLSNKISQMATDAYYNSWF